MHDVDSRKLKSSISGVLVVDKPVGMTSHDVVAFLRKGTDLRRIGHTGTLDPRASGVLVTLVGPAVRLSDYMHSTKKRYEATIRLGAVSNTYDGEGIISKTADHIDLTEDTILSTMKHFTGKFQQVPPAFSALKINGRKAYDLAREGKTVNLKPRDVEVFSFDLLEYNPPDLTVDIFCSAGTYIRSIAHDMGQMLGCGAYLNMLRRTMCGKFTLRDAISLAELQKNFDEGTWYQHLIPAADALSDYFEVDLDMAQENEICHGRRIPADTSDYTVAKAVSEQGELIALLEFCPDTKEWKPKKVFYS